jgi:hypothetical protein
MLILSLGYLSHHLVGQEVSEKEMKDFMVQFDQIKKCEEKSLAIIETLFPIEKERD